MSEAPDLAYEAQAARSEGVVARLTEAILTSSAADAVQNVWVVDFGPAFFVSLLCGRSLSAAEEDDVETRLLDAMRGVTGLPIEVNLERRSRAVGGARIYTFRVEVRA